MRENRVSYARPVNSRPAAPKWTSEDTENAVIAGGCCLLVVFLLILGVLPYIIWAILYTQHGSPDLFSQWNPWNISLLAIIAVQTFSGYCKKASS